MAEIVIQAREVGKQYRLGTHLHGNLREAITHAAAAPKRWLTGASRRNQEPETIWALRDLDLDVRRGDVLGIVGKNGAGKSTLLKLLSHITEPTTGSIDINGRVGSLLEVGTGFHPELTGRENIFLNGAILGMSRREIERKFDQIVDFAEIPKFIDTPVKRYSSGMYTRLAFAVAAHLEPEILIVDEVLAVGDGAFQTKCIGKMAEIAGEGRTVLFVSHNLTAVRRLCKRAILLHEGRLLADGETGDVIAQYLQTAQEMHEPEMDLTEWTERIGIGKARIVHARLLDEHETPCSRFRRGGRMTLEFTFDNETESALNLSAVCNTTEGTRVLHTTHYDDTSLRLEPFTGRAVVRFSFDRLPLFPGEYVWHLGVQTELHLNLDIVQNVLHFHVDDMEENPRPYNSDNYRQALCWAPTRWTIDLTPDGLSPDGLSPDDAG